MKYNCFDIKTVLTLTWVAWNRTVWKQKLYLYYTELFVLELFDKTELFEIETKKRQILRSCQRNEKAMKYESEGCNWCTWNDPQMFCINISYCMIHIYIYIYKHDFGLNN